MILHSLRKASPKFIKKIYRILSSFYENQSSPVISAKKLTNAKLFANRKVMVDELFQYGNILEVGTETGKFASFLLSLPGLNNLTTIDIDYSLFKLSPQANLKCLKGYSDITLTDLSEDFSLIYLDAAHDYNNVKKDLAAMCHLLKPGTILIFNDFAIVDQNFGRYGVHRAASEFVNDNKCSVVGLALEKNAQYDLAVIIE